DQPFEVGAEPERASGIRKHRIDLRVRLELKWNLLPSPTAALGCGDELEHFSLIRHEHPALMIFSNRCYRKATNFAGRAILDDLALDDFDQILADPKPETSAAVREGRHSVSTGLMWRDDFESDFTVRVWSTAIQADIRGAPEEA